MAEGPIGERGRSSITKARDEQRRTRDPDPLHPDPLAEETGAVMRRIRRETGESIPAADESLDWAEIWGRRIARGLATTVMIGLLVALVFFVLRR